MGNVMKEHYTEADLLETYYTQPGESMPVMMHLARCTECAARYERLERKLREAAACHAERGEDFWARQRQTIMQTITRQRASSGASLRVAAAALLALLLGGFGIYRLFDSSDPLPAAVTQPPAVEEEIPSDPWHSDELQEFHAVVEWESWIGEPDVNGELSL
jgi:hypothetical protein